MGGVVVAALVIGEQLVVAECGAPVCGKRPVSSADKSLSLWVLFQLGAPHAKTNPR